MYTTEHIHVLPGPFFRSALFASDTADVAPSPAPSRVDPLLWKQVIFHIKLHKDHRAAYKTGR